MSRDSQDERSFSRRKCLKGIGAAGVTFGFASNPASANGKLRIKRIRGGKRSKVIEDARSTDEFELFATALQREGISFDATEVNAFKVFPASGGKFELVSFVDDSVDAGGVNISIPLGGDSVAKATVTELDDRDRPVTITEFGRGGVVSTSTANGLENVSTRTTTTNVGGTTVTKKTHDLSGWFNDGEVTTQASYCSDFPDTIGCGDCKNMVTILNSLSCSLQTAAYCSFVTAETGVGPLACAAAFGVLCLVVTTFGISNPQDVCEKVCAC
ncbi:hypothetical protein [Halorussus aquaticus]|uniref:Halocin C8-like bacteriocin domain-containing protein n=1 Tax=Halorussus aquaticus TaxID=2953748 RepID=A0ABD5Q7Q6_9EURY|nr:hypothetical protein [Halorussus aquaticus]